MTNPGPTIGNQLSPDQKRPSSMLTVAFAVLCLVVMGLGIDCIAQTIRNVRGRLEVGRLAKQSLRARPVGGVDFQPVGEGTEIKIDEASARWLVQQMERETSTSNKPLNVETSTDESALATKLATVLSQPDTKFVLENRKELELAVGCVCDTTLPLPLRNAWLTHLLTLPPHDPSLVSKLISFIDVAWDQPENFDRDQVSSLIKTWRPLSPTQFNLRDRRLASKRTSSADEKDSPPNYFNSSLDRLDLTPAKKVVPAVNAVANQAVRNDGGADKKGTTGPAKDALPAGLAIPQFATQPQPGSAAELSSAELVIAELQRGDVDGKVRDSLSDAAESNPVIEKLQRQAMELLNTAKAESNGSPNEIPVWVHRFASATQNETLFDAMQLFLSKHSWGRAEDVRLADWIRTALIDGKPHWTKAFLASLPDDELSAEAGEKMMLSEQLDWPANLAVALKRLATIRSESTSQCDELIAEYLTSTTISGAIARQSVQERRHWSPVLVEGVVREALDLKGGSTAETTRWLKGCQVDHETRQRIAAKTPESASYATWKQLAPLLNPASVRDARWRELEKRGDLGGLLVEWLGRHATFPWEAVPATRDDESAVAENAASRILGAGSTNAELDAQIAVRWLTQWSEGSPKRREAFLVQAGRWGGPKTLAIGEAIQRARPAPDAKFAVGVSMTATEFTQLEKTNVLLRSRIHAE